MKSNNIDTSTAIFIDGDWFYTATRRVGRDIDFAKFFDILIKKFGVKTKVHYYGTIDPISERQEKFYKKLKKIGYIIHCTKIKKINNRVVSNRSIDVSLVVDAMRILPLLKNIILVSGDSDFTSLLQQARKFGVKTYVIALPFSTGYLLRQVANTFLNLETLIVERKPKTLKKGMKIEKFAAQNYIKQCESFKSYKKLRNLMTSAQKSITIVDQYIDEQILLMIEPLKTKINIIIITNAKNVTPIDFCVQVKKLKEDGHLINIYDSKKFHDRFIIIDNTPWHSGYSFKDLGKKDSMFSKVNKKTAEVVKNEITNVIQKNFLHCL